LEPGHVSLNLTLRKAFQLYANLLPCRSIAGLKTHYANVHVAVVRENIDSESHGAKGSRVETADGLVPTLEAAFLREEASIWSPCRLTIRRTRGSLVKEL
jgi:isocitrate/isopropylmalate dehydrogenase